MGAEDARERLADEATWRTDPEVIAQPMGHEVMLLHLRTNRFYGLNRTAARLWEGLAAGESRQEICGRLTAEFSVDPADVDREVDTMLASLLEQGLVSRDDRG